MHASAARAPRGGRERRVGLRKPVVVRSERRPADRHSGGRLDGPIGFPKAHPSLPPGERAVRVRTETLRPAARWCGATLAAARPRRRAMPFNRRRFMAGALALGASRLTGRRATAQPRLSANPFTLGVASGYPMPAGVVLWTRIAPTPLLSGGGMPREAVPVEWRWRPTST